MRPTVENVPLFRTIEPYQPRPAALLNGGLLAVALLWAIATAVTHGGGPGRIFLIGVHHASPHLLPVARDAVTPTDLNTLVKFGPAPEDPWRAIASIYFKIIRVLKVLDSDQDLVISPWESFTAPAALRRLDTNHDGKLSAEECGFFMGEDSALPAESVGRARLAFMRENPVLAALDADHDGEISAAEIANSAHALQTLDRNHDGSLTPAELIPDRLASQAAMILVKLDTDSNGSLSPAEWENEAKPLRDLLQSADRNHDGVVTRKELENELHLREEQTRDVERARHAARIPQ